jgi:hypothetical protein
LAFQTALPMKQSARPSPPCKANLKLRKMPLPSKLIKLTASFFLRDNVEWPKFTKPACH